MSAFKNSPAYASTMFLVSEGYNRSVVALKSHELQVLHKSYLLEIRVAASETAMADVLREVSLNFISLAFW